MQNAHTQELKSLLSVNSKFTRFIRLKVQRNNFKISDCLFLISAPKALESITDRTKKLVKIPKIQV